MYDTTPIETVMEREDLTNEKVAVKAGLSSSTVGRIRRKDESTNLQSLKKFGDALEMDVEIRFVPRRARRAVQHG